MPEADAAWARASVLRAMGGTKYEVRIDGIDDNEEAAQSDWGAGEVRQVDLAGDDRQQETRPVYAPTINTASVVVLLYS